mmetsp:Transcript_29587/g.48825  ORF Transcript_29587/g.48825 Transcript_29587/m.48825 type:complete len:103 (+) Transcript_29587:798-1106(+)
MLEDDTRLGSMYLTTKSPSFEETRYTCPIPPHRRAMEDTLLTDERSSEMQILANRSASDLESDIACSLARSQSSIYDVAIHCTTRTRGEADHNRRLTLVDGW